MSQGLAACAECKRMKLKCDKKVPCSSCVRRECSGICPTGTLTSLQESRAILVEGSTGRQAQDEIARLRKRNLQLENALAFAHSHISMDAHPLLAEATLKKQQDNLEVDQVAEVLGTMALGDTGEVKYFGPFATTESLYQAVSTADEPPASAPSLPKLDPTLDSFSTQSPHSLAPSMEYFAARIISDLPERKRASSLCENFYEQYTFFSMPIPREELNQAYISPIYNFLDESRINPSIPLPLLIFRPHRCAVIFFTFALGAWLDLAQEHYWVEADRYFQIGLSCLSVQSIFYSPEVASVQALFLLAYYSELRGAASSATLSPSWTILSLACKISQGLGLHRDPSHWDFDQITVQSRRWLYWELVSMETFHSLGVGRPLGGRLSYVDTEVPDDIVQTDAHGQRLQGFFRCKHEFVRDCYIDVVEALLAAAPAKYETILELDRKVRSKEIPAHLNRILIDNEDGPSLTAPEFMHTCIMGVARSLALVSIHRTYLPKALEDPSGNPLKSRYAPSFLASYRAASWIVKCFHGGQKRFPALFSRLWHPWTHILSAAMILGCIAIHAPLSLVGNNPLEQLRVASSMFEDAATHTVSHRTKSGAKIIQKILARAEEAYSQHSTSVSPLGIPIPPTNYGDDELAIFGGQTRILPTTTRQRLQHSGGDPSSSSYDSASSASSPESLEDAHPSLIEFLNTAPATRVASPTTFQELQMNTFESSHSSSFHNRSVMSYLPGSWAHSLLPVPQNSYDFGIVSGSSTSQVQMSDMFENYLEPPEPSSEPHTANQWQGFM
ncbi:hypothetical protein DL96DRAFT_1609019 [Flagelloscypha sp. PMI_526]|nr:hypothetical protein DL96DRAFT_1609019 [Flagelloscypha sp. PMI_526]